MRFGMANSLDTHLGLPDILKHSHKYISQYLGCKKSWIGFLILGDK